MSWDSLRDFLVALEQDGKLQKITTEVHWDQEIGGIARAALDSTTENKALLFTTIKGYENTTFQKLVTLTMGTYSRIAAVMGLDYSTNVRDLIQIVRKRNKTPLDPILQASGPVKENIISQDKVDLTAIPVPQWNARDGGRYINTFCGVVTKDPDTGNINVGMYRGMIADKNLISVNLVPGKHWGQHYSKYRERGVPMPVAVFFGGSPILNFVAAAPYPGRISEYALAGGLQQAAIPLVKCETVDLEVPAGAEIVLEGEIPIDPSSYRLEGPFGEFTGYYGGKASKKPVIEVRCITHRNDPIFVGSPEGMPATEDHLMCSVFMSAIAWDALERNDVPGITDVFVPPVGAATNIRVQIRKQYQGHAKQVAACLWGMNTITFFKNVIVVEEDIDIYDYAALEWAFAYRVDAFSDGIVVFPGMPGTALDPSTDPELNDTGKFGVGRWNRVLIDATREWRWGFRKEWDGERYAPKVEISKEIKELVKSRWKEYGFKG